MSSTERCQWCGAENPTGSEFCGTCRARLRAASEVAPATAPSASSLAGAPPAATPPPPPSPLGTAPVPAPPPPAPASPGLGAPATQAPPPAAHPTGLPTGGEPLPSLQAADRRPIPASTWVILGVVLAAVVVLGVVLLRTGSSISMPDSIEGRAQMTEPFAAGAIDQIKSEADDQGIELEAAFYGRSGVPAFMVIALMGGGSEEAQQIFDLFIAGVESGGQASVDASGQRAETREGVRYICAPMAGQGFTELSLCQWHDGDTTGFVLSFESSDPVTTMDLSTKVHRAVVG